MLEKAFEDAQAQAAHHREQMSEMQESLKKATKVLQVSVGVVQQALRVGSGA